MNFDRSVSLTVLCYNILSINSVILALCMLEYLLLSSYLIIQNIFLGEDIRKQLPRESAEFDGVNTSWKEIMTRMNKDNNALRGTHHEGKICVSMPSMWTDHTLCLVQI